MSVCSTCNVSLSSEAVRKQHEQGRAHQRLSKASNFKCSICDVRISSDAARKQHERGKKHRRRAEVLRHAEETLADLTGLYERVMPLLLQDPPVDVYIASLSSLARTLKKRNFGPACITCLLRVESQTLLRSHLFTCSCGETFSLWKDLTDHLKQHQAHTVHIYSINMLKEERAQVLDLIAGMHEEDEETQRKIHKAKIVFAAKYSLLIHLIRSRQSEKLFE